MWFATFIENGLTRFCLKSKRAAWRAGAIGF
jgi:hypothetical protein